MRKLYIQDAAAAAKGIDKKDVDEIITWADETVSGVICHRAHYEMERCYIPVAFSDSIWNTVPAEILNNDPEWLYALNRHSILLNLAKAFVLTGQGKYRDTFVRMITSYLDNTSYSEECLNSSWRSLETGIRPENWIRSIELFDSLDPLPSSVVSRMEESLGVHIRQLLDTHRAFQRLSNWGVIQEHGLFVAAAALGDESSMKIALDRLEEELLLQALEDGEDWEQSPLYHTEVLHSALDTILVGRRLGIVIPDIIIERATMMAKALYDMTLGDSSLIPTGDSDIIKTDDLLYLSSYLFSLPFECSKCEENYWDGITAPALSLVPRESVFHKASGNVFLRSQSITAHMVSGLMGSGHGHLCPLHVDIAIGNTLMVTDTGRYTYVDSNPRKELKDFESHNVFTVDGKVPERAVGSWGYTGIFDKELTNAVFSKDYDVASGIYLGYLNDGVLTRRKLLRIGNSAVVVIDEILGDESRSFEYEAFWHLPSDATFSDSIIKRGNAVLGFSTTASSLSEAEGLYSDTYNVLEKSKVIKTHCRVNGMGSVVTVFTVGGNGEVECLETELIDSGRKLNGSEACSFSLKAGNDEWIVVSRSREIAAQVDIIKASYLEGYGRLIIMKKGDKFPLRLF